MKPNKKLTKNINEALETFNTKNRLQELAGVKQTGCVSENLQHGSPEWKALDEGIRRWAENASVNRRIGEAEKADNAEKKQEPICMKNIDLQAGTATGCWHNCGGGFGGVMCNGCDCFGELGGMTTQGGFGHLPLDLREDKMAGGEGACIKNVQNDGADITFDNCDASCSSSADCEGDCWCCGKVAGMVSPTTPQDVPLSPDSDFTTGPKIPPISPFDPNDRQRNIDPLDADGNPRPMPRGRR